MMEKRATTLQEAINHFAESTEPITCSKEGTEDTVANTLEEAEAFYADNEEDGYQTTDKSEGGVN